MPNYEKRAPNGTDGGYTLDHITSVVFGYKNKIPAKIIANIENLRMMPWKDNIIKGWK